VTLSFANTPEGVSAVNLIQSVFTDKNEKGELLAGGHAGIAGSPRGRRATLAELVSVVSATQEALNG